VKRTAASHGALRTFAWPLAIALVTLAALVLGLLGTGAADVVAAAALAVPAAVALRGLLSH
jgi:hypothetical protein